MTQSIQSPVIEIKLTVLLFWKSEASLDNMSFLNKALLFVMLTMFVVTIAETKATDFAEIAVLQLLLSWVLSYSAYSKLSQDEMKLH